MDESASLAERFEAHRTRLRGVAYRMLGSLPDAEDAVQDAWLRVNRADTREIENFGGWLTTIVARLCLNILQARKLRAEEPTGSTMPDPIVTPDGSLDPEHEVLLADAVGLALQIVLETLPAAERLAFVLHDMFDMPFDEIAAILGRSPAATRQLASRARRRVQGAAVRAPDPDLARQRQVVDAFFAAAQRGDFDALVAVLDPEVVSRNDRGGIRRGAVEVARGALAGARAAVSGAAQAVVVRPALVNGAAGAVVLADDRLHAVMAFTVSRGKIVEIDVVLDPGRLGRLDLGALAQ
jgi:RNA polymerase sigma factor (sigma-70 family)